LKGKQASAIKTAAMPQKQWLNASDRQRGIAEEDLMLSISSNIPESGEYFCRSNFYISPKVKNSELRNKEINQ
jgi:hypothetical protein